MRKVVGPGHRGDHDLAGVQERRDDRIGRTSKLQPTPAELVQIVAGEGQAKDLVMVAPERLLERGGQRLPGPLQIVVDDEQDRPVPPLLLPQRPINVARLGGPLRERVVVLRLKDPSNDAPTGQVVAVHEHEPRGVRGLV